jgi:hypothetical protein
MKIFDSLRQRVTRETPDGIEALAGSFYHYITGTIDVIGIVAKPADQCGIPGGRRLATFLGCYRL